MKKIVILLLLAFVTLLPFTTFAQGTPKIGIDESNVIFAGCRLSNLQAAYPGATPAPGADIGEPGDVDGSGIDNPGEEGEEGDEGDTGEDSEDLANEKEIIEANNNLDAADVRNKYIKGCVQEIIRFVIIMASLAAILNIAVAGILQLTDPNAKPIRTKLTNTIIGLFLLIVGWNLIPIFNNSFNNVNFLSLPGVNVCTQANYCTSEAQQLQRKYYNCMKRYQNIKIDKEFSESPELQKNLETCIAQFCVVKNQYPRIRSSYCIDYKKPGSIVAEINRLIKEGKAERAKRTVSGAPAQGAAPADPSCPEPEKGPEALKAGYIHYKYAVVSPSLLVKVESAQLHKDAAKAYNEMKAAAAKDDVTFYIQSGFRSIATQKQIVDKKRKELKSEKEVFASSSEPGYSEHHTGMALDVNSVGVKDLTAGFADTKEGKWIAENATKFGFELSFPTSNKQKVNFEPWHLRYTKTDPKLFCYASKK
jgi:zinc D-Ala-D-Ala carboxypeptidase